MMKRKAYQKILARHKSDIYSYVFYLCRNREDAEDITQDVFVRLWNHWDRIQQPKVHSWLMRVAHNRSIDLLRKYRSSRSNVDTQDILERLPNSDYQSFCPEQSTVLSDEREHLIRAMDTLPDKTRSLLLMHYFQDMKYDTIADILDISVSNIKIIIHRGKKDFERC